MSKLKQRPLRGELTTPDMSERDICVALGISRLELWERKQLATVPKEEFEALLNAPIESLFRRRGMKQWDKNIGDVARRRAGLEPRDKSGYCPHCGQPMPRACTIDFRC